MMDSRLGAPAAVPILPRESASIITASFLAQYYHDFVKRNEMTSMLDLYGDNAHITLADVSEESPTVAQGRRAVLLHLAKIDSLLAQRKVEIITADSVPLPAGGVHIICQGIMFLRNFRRVFLQTFILMPTLYREKTFHIVSDYLRFVNSEEEVIPAGVPILTPDQVSAHLAEEARRRDFELEQQRLMELKQQLWEEQRAEEAAARAREQREQQEKREREERQRREREEQQQQYMKQHQNHSQQQSSALPTGSHASHSNYGAAPSRPPAAPRSTQQQQQQQHSSYLNESERAMDQQQGSTNEGTQRGQAGAGNSAGTPTVRVGSARANMAVGAAPAYNNNTNDNNNNSSNNSMNINYRASGFSAGPSAGRMSHTHAKEQRRYRGGDAAEPGALRNTNRPARMPTGETAHPAEHDNHSPPSQEEEKETYLAAAGRSDQSERPPRYISSRRVCYDTTTTATTTTTNIAAAKPSSSSTNAADVSRAVRVGEAAAANAVPSGRTRCDADESRKPNPAPQSGTEATTSRAGREERGSTRDRRNNYNTNESPSGTTYAQKVADGKHNTNAAASSGHANAVDNPSSTEQRGNNNNNNNSNNHNKRVNLTEASSHGAHSSNNNNNATTNNTDPRGNTRDAVRLSRHTGSMSSATVSEPKSATGTTTRLDKRREGGGRAEMTAAAATATGAESTDGGALRRPQRGDAASGHARGSASGAAGSTMRRERHSERKPREDNDAAERAHANLSTDAPADNNNKSNANVMDGKPQSLYEENKENAKRGRDRASSGARRKNGLTSTTGSGKERSAEPAAGNNATNNASNASSADKNTHTPATTVCATETTCVRLINVPKEIKLSDIKKTLMDEKLGEARDAYWFGRDRSHAVVEMPTSAIAQKLCGMHHIKIINSEVKVVTFYR